MAPTLVTLSLLCGVVGALVRPPPLAATKVMQHGGECVEEFEIQRRIKVVRVFEGDYAGAIRAEVASVGAAAIAAKGTFSLCVPGGSVVAALKALEPDALDFSKVHVFFANEGLEDTPCYKGAVDALGDKMPVEQIHAVEGTTSAEAAKAYEALLRSHPSIDQAAGAFPSVDMILLGTGADGHCGSIYPDSDEVKAAGATVHAMAKPAIAVSISVMSAAKVAIVSAAGEGRAPMVAKALSGEYGAFDCPAALVDAQEDTLWFVDQDSIREFDTTSIDTEDDEEEGEDLE